MYTGFARDCLDLEEPTPFAIKVCSGCESSFFVDVKEFERSSIDLERPLLQDKVFILWKWESDLDRRQDYTMADVYSTRESPNKTDDDNKDEKKYKEPSVDNSSHAHGTHTITFKCMGTTKDNRYQFTLAEASHKLNNGSYVAVRLREEPDNPKDSKAIAFDCQLDHGAKWERIGYVVREALDGVHSAIQSQAILSVKFKWIRFITHWSRSSMGWYCGISITKSGTWSREVVCHKSTL